MANNNYFIHNAKIVNEGRIFKGDVVVQDGFIKLVINNKHSIEDILLDESTEYIDSTLR